MRPVFCALIAVLLAGAGGAAAPPATVSAAVSLTEALQAAAAAYAKDGGGSVRFNFGPSNGLARQIVAGAPVDLFISADEAQMDVVSSADRLAEGSRVDLLANQLVVLVPDDRPRTFARIRDLLDPAFRRIAVGDTAAVPAGVYAKSYLEKAGLWDALAPRLIPCSSVRAALAAVDQGSADAAIVYRTDVHAASHSIVAWTVPVADGPRIVYPAALIRDGPSPAAARRFLAYLQAPAAARIFEQHGFAPLHD